MRLKTSIQGVLTIELTQSERKAMASTHVVLEHLAFYHRPAAGDEASGFFVRATQASAFIQEELARPTADDPLEEDESDAE